MKVLFATYPWAFDCPGGGECQLIAYKKHLNKHDVKVNLYDLWNPLIDEYDVFHFFSVIPGSLQLCDYIKKKGIPLVISPNLWITPDTIHLYPMDDIKNLLPLADRIIVNSDMEGDSLSEVFNIERERFVTVYNGYEEEYLTPVSAEHFRDTYNITYNYILNVANVEPRKNQLNLIYAMKEHPDLKIINIGYIRDKEYANKCHASADGQFICLGPQQHSTSIIKSAISGCEFFAMPSFLETPSIAALEAKAGKAKVLITEIGSTTEYFGESVVYVNPESIDSIASGIDRILSEEQSSWPEIDYLWSNVITKLTNCYYAVVASHP